MLHVGCFRIEQLCFFRGLNLFQYICTMLRITTSDPRNTNRSVLQRVIPVISYMLSKLFEPYRSKKEYQTVSRFPMLFFTKNYYFYMIYVMYFKYYQSLKISRKRIISRQTFVFKSKLSVNSILVSPYRWCSDVQKNC